MGCGNGSRIEALEAENCNAREQLAAVAKTADLRAAADEAALEQRAAKANALVSDHEAERARIRTQLEESMRKADQQVSVLEAEKLELRQRRRNSKMASARQREVIEVENSSLRENLESDRVSAEARLAILGAEKAQLIEEKARCGEGALAHIQALEIDNAALQRDVENYQAEAVSGEAMLRAGIESVREAARMREEGLQTEITHILAEVELARQAASKAAEAQLASHQLEVSQFRTEMERSIKGLEAKTVANDATLEILQRMNAQLMTDRIATAERQSAASRAKMRRSNSVFGRPLDQHGRLLTRTNSGSLEL